MSVETLPDRARTATPADRRCFTVVAAGQTYGLPVEYIQTVFEITAITHVPRAPYEVLGLVNLRGKIVTAVSLRRRLRRDPIEVSQIAVGIDHRNESFALLVDEVGDVITLDKGTSIEAPPHIGTEGVAVEAMYRLEELILPVLDLDWIFALSGKE